MSHYVLGPIAASLKYLGGTSFARRLARYKGERLELGERFRQSVFSVIDQIERFPESAARVHVRSAVRWSHLHPAGCSARHGPKDLEILDREVVEAAEVSVTSPLHVRDELLTRGVVATEGEPPPQAARPWLEHRHPPPRRKVAAQPLKVEDLPADVVIHVDHHYEVDLTVGQKGILCTTLDYFNILQATLGNLPLQRRNSLTGDLDGIHPARRTNGIGKEGYEVAITGSEIGDTITSLEGEVLKNFGRELPAGTREQTAQIELSHILVGKSQ